MDRADRSPAVDRIGDDERRGPLPGPQQPERLPLVLAELDPGRRLARRPSPAHHLQAGRIVVAQLVADADHEHPRHGVYPRSTVSVRKWVAQEMQGSWLRI